MTSRKQTRAFTLIELMVVTGIIAIISGLVLVNNNRFGGAVLLENLAYDMALSIRQAQIYGISVQRFQGAFGAAYGVHLTPSAGSAQSVYVLFADVDGNGKYNEGELVQSTTVAQGYSISDICVATVGGTQTCASAANALRSLDITFQRPEPDAFIRINGDSLSLYESATITISSPRADKKKIIVYANGQISVQ